MEPVTHILTGACLSRAGLNSRAAYASLTMAVAAEFPDIDTLWSLRGPVAGFQHHRGFTHTFAALPAEAVIVVAAIYGLHRFRVYRAARNPDSKPLTFAPVRWGLLYGFAILALLSHLLLDYTNNYGLRPFFPFNPRWYTGSFVFIFDPVVFLLLVMALLMPQLFALIGSEVGARKERFRGQGWAAAALVCIACWGAFRAFEHSRASQVAASQTMAIRPSDAPADAPLQFLQPQRVLANPDPFNPFLWHIVSDFGSFYQLGDANLLTGALTPAQDIHAKPRRTPAILAADGSTLGRAYLDWSPMPLITESAPGDPTRPSDLPGDENGATSAANTIVTYRDPRFMVDLPLLRSRPIPPLTGTVELDSQLHIVRQTMDGFAQH